MDITKITLGELLSVDDETIRRNSIAILKRLQKMEYSIDKKEDKIIEGEK